MFKLNKEDMSISVTRGDVLYFDFYADDGGKNYKFQPGDVLQISVAVKKDMSTVVLQKRFGVEDYTEKVRIYLTKHDTRIGGVISKPTDYWYQIRLNPDDETPQSIVAYDEDGPKLFRLFPEAEEINEPDPAPEDIPIVDQELDMTSQRPVANQAISRAYQELLAGYERTHAAVAKLHVTPQMFGAIGDGVADDTESFQAALDTKEKLYVPSGVYKITNQLTAYNSITFDKDAYIEFYPEENGATCIKISGSVTRLYDNLACTVDGMNMTANVSGLQAGDYIYLSNAELVAPTARAFDTKRDISQIQALEGNTITLTAVPEYSYSSVNIDKINFIDNIIIDGAKIKCMAKYGNTNGITLEYCKNATIKNCHISGFDYAQVNLNYCTYCDAHSNLCEVNYAEELQYGIVVHSSTNITVYGNKVNSHRTAIDVTRVSNKVTVTGNTVIGNINTHSCTNTNITNNTINDGMILIRGKNVVVNGNNVQCLAQSCIDIEEMGVEGGHIISNNIFSGFCSMKCFLSNISITGNHFIVKKVLSYNSGAFESVIRLMTAGTPEKTDGAVISGNTFDAVGIKPIYCIEANANMNTIYNLIIQDNVIRGFQTALYLPQITSVVGDNLIVKNNLLKVTASGIVFRLVNNTQIVGNTVIGVEKGNTGIARHNIDDTETTGLIIKDNFVKNFAYGVRINGGADMKKAVYMDNIYQDCDTRSTGVSGNTTRIDNELFVSSPNGTVYNLKVSDSGTLTPASQGYTI